ncbi:hypothetical protein [Streptomyces sp. NPDC094149]|uniref:hypothetical protein n=1 Tax=Streptomyces sp. NPDC094149 TaxID=3155079 RepID=UPI00332BBF3E
MTLLRLVDPRRTIERAARFGLSTAGQVTDRLIRTLTAAVVDRLDLDDLAGRLDVNRVADRVDVMRVAGRVDIDALADQVDVDRIVERVDVNRVAARLDVEAVAGRVDLDRIAERIDVDRIAARIDVDRVAARLDIDGVIARVDLVTLTRAVLEEIDLGRIVRETSGGMADETVDALRLRSARADRMVNRVADRLLHRPAPETPRADGDGRSHVLEPTRAADQGGSHAGGSHARETKQVDGDAGPHGRESALADGDGDGDGDSDGDSGQRVPDAARADGHGGSLGPAP